MCELVKIDPPRLDTHDNGFSLFLKGKSFDLSSTYDLAKLNERNLRLVFKMQKEYNKLLEKFNQDFTAKYTSQIDITNKSPVGDEEYDRIEGEIESE